MKNLKPAFIVALALFIVSSCTIEKRIHNKGFHVEWKKKYKSLKGGENANEDVAQERIPYSAKVRNSETLHSEDALAFENEERVADLEVIENKESDKNNDPSVKRLPVSGEDISEDTYARSANITQAPNKTSENKKKAKASKSAGGSSQIIALILVIFLGLLGIHRFYLGYTGIGVLMLLTAGVFGILALIDLIRIVMGTLKPKNGEYTEKL